MKPIRILAIVGLLVFAWLPFFAQQSHGTWQQHTITRSLTSIFYHPPTLVTTRLLTPSQYTDYYTAIPFVWSTFVTVLGGTIIVMSRKKGNA
jgi:hypothetical protein